MATLQDRAEFGRRCRAAARAARAAPHAPLAAAAAAAGVSGSALSGALRGFRPRGRCASLAAVASESPVAHMQQARRWYPPAVARRLADEAGSFDAGDAVAVAGVAGWRSRTVQDPGVSRAGLAVAACTGSRSDRAGVLRNGVCPAVFVVAMASDPDDEIRAEAAAVVSCPQIVLGALAADYAAVLQVVSNPSTADSVLAAAAVGYLVDSVVDALADNPNLGAAALTVMARHDDCEVRAAAADHERSSPCLLEMLATDNDDEIREFAARNPNCGQTTLARLAHDPVWEVKAAVAANPNTVPDTLRMLAADDDYDVIRNVADHNKCDQSIVAVLADHHQIDARIAAARHRRCSPHTLEVLARDAQWQIRAAVATNGGCAQKLLQRLAADDDFDVRSGVCANPNITPDLLGMLTADEHHTVRICAEEAAAQI